MRCFGRRKIESSPLFESAESPALSIPATREGESGAMGGGAGIRRGPCIGEERVRRWYGAGCPLGETFNRLAANAFKMAGSVRSPLIAGARIRWRRTGCFARFMDSLGHSPAKLSCLSGSGLRVPGGLARNQSFGGSLPDSRGNSEWDCVFETLRRYRYKQRQKAALHIYI